MVLHEKCRGREVGENQFAKLRGKHKEGMQWAY